VLLDKDRTMENIQKHNIHNNYSYINISDKTGLVIKVSSF
jgi:hypothetical protein